MRFILFALIVFLVGCAQNSSFYYPSRGSLEIAEDPRYPYEDFWLESESGNALHAQMHLSDHEKPKGVVLHFHGNRGDLSVSLDKLKWLLEQGYDLVVFDYSGFGLSSGKPTPENTRHDALAFLTYFANLERRHPGYRKIVWGTSLGGAILSDGFSVFGQQNQFDLVIVDSSFHSYRKQAEHIVSGMLGGVILKWVVPMVISDDYSPIHNVQRIQASKFLFVHCVDDRIVPVELGWSLYEPVRVSKYFWKVDGCRHARPFGEAFVERREILLAFLQSPQLVERVGESAVAAEQKLSLQGVHLLSKGEKRLMVKDQME